MKLCIKQKVFSWVDRFTVFDETGADKYYVEGEIFLVGKEAASLPTLTGRETRIHPAEGVQHDASLLCVHGRRLERAEIVKRFTFFFEKLPG